MDPDANIAVVGSRNLTMCLDRAYHFPCDPCAVRHSRGLSMMIIATTFTADNFLQGGFIPDIVLWLSYFYTSRELPIRLSYFWTSLSVTSILTSLLAFALLHLRGVNGWGGWRWLFLVEGLITFLVGVASFFLMPASAVQTKTWFRPKGWFTDREVAIVVNRVLRDDPSKGDMNNRQAITFKRLWEAMKDFDLWPLYIIGAIAFIPQSPPSTYITLTLRKLGFDPFNTNLLTIPYVSRVGALLSCVSLTAIRTCFTSLILSC